MKRVLLSFFILVLVVAVGRWRYSISSHSTLLVNTSSFSQAVYARGGELLRLSLSSDEKYRLWTPLRGISKNVIEGTLLQEDRYFWIHPGINPYSLIRAAISTYITGDRKFGASTITMQLARMRFGIDSKSILGKLSQIGRALMIETLYSKEEILEAYLNLAPYGGNIEGVGAASIIYFGKDVSKLTLAEGFTLAVIPQNPGTRSPHKSIDEINPELKVARNRLYATYVSQSTRAQDVQNMEVAEEPLKGRHEIPFRAPHFVDLILKRETLNPRIETTLDLRLQGLLERQFDAFFERNYKLGIRNGSALLLDYNTMEVRGYVGSRKFFNSEIQGQVDGTLGKRSPGSTLKPFIYALALDQGLIHPRTMLKDAPTTISAYTPENFDKVFLGPVDATEALVRSRNVPAIALANRLRSPGLYSFLKSAGVRLNKDENFYGLALVLGGVEVTMQELSRMYALLANGGALRDLQFLPSSEVDRDRPQLLSPESSYLTIQMLSENPRPDGDFNKDHIPWKTGTSYGFRDAWSIGVVGPYVLAIWIGNFDGTPNAAFVGREAAGPLFFSIADAIKAQGELREYLPPSALKAKKVKVCALSGQLPGPFCSHTKESWFIPGVSPIEQCSIHRELLINPVTGKRLCPGQDSGGIKAVYEFWPSDLLNLFSQAGIPRKLPPPYDSTCDLSSSGKGPEITSPLGTLEYVIHINSEDSVPFRANTDGDNRVVYWFLNERFVGSSNPSESLFWRAEPGEFVVKAVDDRGRSSSSRLKVAVIQ